jgi:uncharacterized protein
MNWQPQALQEFIVKIHSRCNLRCDYCYIYEMDDATWREQPGAMSPEVARIVARRICEHARRHELGDVVLVLHGGEPLLVRPKRMEHLLDIFLEELRPAVKVRFAMQTNGVLLDDDVLELLSNYNVSFGVSLDGGEHENDRHRKTKSGAGSYTAVAERIRALQNSEQSYLFDGFLATIDVDNDPIAVYRSLRSLHPPAMDFLLPHGNWSEPPPRGRSQSATPFADWLITLFDHWFPVRHDEPSIRIFETIISGALGRSTTNELIGLTPVRLAVIETDGSYELVDVMKTAYEGAAKTGLDAFRHDLDAVLNHPSVAVRQCGVAGLSPTCRSCSVVDVCGGGYYPHRYRAGSGFLNPSVFCRDLELLCNHVVRVVDAIASR